MSERPAPPIPRTLINRPTTPDGLVIPWINVQLADGGADFRSQHNTRFAQAWIGKLCQSCGQKLTAPVVCLCGPNQLEQLLFDEPPTHPECALYAVSACPMVGGRQDRYRDTPSLSEGKRGRRCPEPGCDCGGLVQTAGSSAGGDPAHPWYAVYLRSYGLACSADGNRLFGGYADPDWVIRVVQVSTPGQGAHLPPTPVRDWRDRYRKPELADAEAMADAAGR